jgi:chromosomal replication initiation ATPase DnaA
MQKQLILKSILQEIISKLKKQDFLVYFRRMSIIEINDNKIIFGVVSSFMRDNLSAKFNDIIIDSSKTINDKIKTVEFKVDDSIDNP